MYKSILITGGSSGIGQSMAEYYAAPGVTIIITGRDEERLSEVKANCEARGATIITKAIDVTDEAAMEAWLNEIDTAHPVDLLMANAGVGALHKVPDIKDYKRVFDTNLYGVLNTVIPIMKRMIERKSGHIAVTSSIASFRGFPTSGAYCASKSAVRALCESWRIEMAPHNVTISTICPGFFRTRMTEKNRFPMPFLMDATDSAQRIAKGLAKKKAIIAYPWPMFMLTRMLQCLPTVISDFLVRSSGRR